MLKRVLTMLLALVLCLSLPCAALAAPLKDTTPSQWQELGYSSMKEYYLARRMEERVEMGGPAEGVGVMWMGEFVQFPDAQPAMVNDRTMVPVRALMERAGATVDYQEATVLLKTEDAEISFRAGETSVTLKKNGETSTIQMDVAPYIDQRRTYVPLRFFSQALGYDVLWDSDYKTAVILDPEAIIDQLNKNFQTVNRFLAAQSMGAADGALQYDTNLSGKMTVFDSMNGNKTATMSGSNEILVSAEGIDSRSSYNIGEMLDMLLALIPNAKDSMSPEDISVMGQLRRMEMEIIYNAAEGKTYLRAPVMSAAKPDIPADAWLEADLDTSGKTALTVSRGASVGALLYAVATADGGVESYADMMESGEALGKVLGDSRFTTVPGGKELTLDMKTLGEDYRQELLAELGSDALKDFSMKLRVNDDGSARLSGSLTLDSGIFGMTCSLEMSISAGKTSAQLSCHVRNLLELTFNGESTVRATTRSPRPAPPAGARIISE